ncbi:SDR family oxidoreductase [Vibrio sp. JC009]|uniref:SDR family oxidoreductase n=1 Tax=Vibrio sp. JC009 TaxID=2912314 RepID=UPI0023AE9F90|nr:SDR family oxidoreductase [Vibrio sp. JC009]WED20923.1 SDR family oxidoreductase [Vibrio sp. JC009]
MDIQNSVVLITSAGSSLGATLASHFAGLGANVVLSDTDKEVLDSVASRCAEVSEKVTCYSLPDHSEKSVQELLSYIANKFDKGVDVLINYWPSSPLPALTSGVSGEDFSKMFVSLATPLFNYGQASASQMREFEKNGVIVNILSLCDNKHLLGFENASSIINGLTKSWAKELTPFNIRVGGVVPSFSHSANNDDFSHWSQINDELIRNTEYIVSNDYFSGRVVAAEA